MQLKIGLKKLSVFRKPKKLHVCLFEIRLELAEPNTRMTANNENRFLDNILISSLKIYIFLRKKSLNKKTIRLIQCIYMKV
jgi:hypothetical protein